ncbi:MAG: FtsQ-type POTRA domain-containing protein [Magnetococcales bacterium]|nr:FtsQ-type POTRA domain-containing protein [Magnetococcales bacterium]MBF0113602.1 FtsQ-type POTRA domain-containing protein [Magnetococcales bacterium]
MLRSQIAFFLLIILLTSMVAGWREINHPGWFPLQEMRIAGLENTSVARATEAVGIEKGSNLLTVQPKNVQNRLEALPWIRSVHVKRQFPSTLLIRVVEKRAVGMVREDDRLFLVDEYGATIKPMEKEDPLMLPIIVSAPGEEKATQVVWLINLLSKHAWLQGRISEAVSYPGGRWTLYTKQGIKLLLSQRIDQELALLKRLQDQYAILDRKVRQVELRISGKAMVRFAL